uniref:ribosomal protein S8 n=1 Tax=Filipendula auriculata TaxID=3015786 RepID=UPI0023EF6C6C|nr:ribosomal protein S8 [Filipendula auriculata]WDZ66442.1 ribosomal protein S8 [Filipendula auriculata]
MLRHRKNSKEPYRTVLKLKQISRPGLRIDSHYQRIPIILGGVGIVCNSLYFSRYNDRPISSNRRDRRRNLVVYMIIFLIAESDVELSYLKKKRERESRFLILCLLD